LFDTKSRPQPCLLSSIHQHILVCIIQILNDLQEAGGHAIALEVLPKGMLSSLLRPNQARVAWESQAPGRAASASGECSGLQGGRLQLMEERGPVTTSFKLGLIASLVVRLIGLLLVLASQKIV